MDARLRSMKRIPSLDGLRAVSISLVVVGHWTELRYHSVVAGAFANLGVKIFFVISGYLITSLLLKEYEKSSTIQLRGFYTRRAYRILPAAIIFKLPVFVIYWHELCWYHLAAAALYLANLDFLHPWFLGHLWSLSVEEQFYFLWPGVLKKWHGHRVQILVGSFRSRRCIEWRVISWAYRDRSTKLFRRLRMCWRWAVCWRFSRRACPRLKRRGRWQ